MAHIDEQSSDGLTTLPSEEELRELGFTDRDPEVWYFSSHLASDIFLTVQIAKEVHKTRPPELLYPYRELIIDNSFGQPAPLGAMSEEFRGVLLQRLVDGLRRLREAGLTISVDPAEYYWEEWTGGRLSGREGEDLIVVTQNAAEASSESLETEPAELAPLRLSSEEALVPTGLDAQDLKRLGELIDREIDNAGWDSLAHGMTPGEYAAPTAIRAYLKLLKEKG